MFHFRKHHSLIVSDQVVCTKSWENSILAYITPAESCLGLKLKLNYVVFYQKSKKKNVVNGTKFGLCLQLLNTISVLVNIYHSRDLLCGLVVRVPGYISRCPGFDSRRYQIFWVVGLERSQLILMRIIEELFQGNSGSDIENRDYRPWGSVALTTQNHLSAKVGINFTDKLRSLGRYSSLADSSHGNWLFWGREQFDLRSILTNISWRGWTERNTES
jgi:hypothetical protein